MFLPYSAIVSYARRLAKKERNMRNVVVSVFTTLNGVMSPVDWPFPYASEDRGRYVRDQLFASDALLMGRGTYEGFAASWPSRTAADAGPGEEGYIERINSLPKYVVSTTLNDLKWNNSHLVRGNVAEEVAKMKEQPGQNILIYGAGPVAHTLVRHGLIDELSVLIYPVIAAVTENTKRLFDDAADIPVLKLAETKAFSSGVVVHEYRLDKSA
jgi:dihydrofolate reductase